MSIAIIASESLQLEALLEALSELEQSPELDLVALDHESQSALYAGRSIAFTHLEDYDFSVCDVCMLLAEGVAAQAALSSLLQSDCQVLAWQSDQDALQALDDSRLHYVATPFVAALNLFQNCVLGPQGIELESIHMTAFLPASLFGQAGVSELASQTAKLLNGQAIDSGIFDSQVTFNYFPLAASHFGASYQSQLTQALQAEFEQSLVQLTALQLPVFHGFSAVLQLELSQPIEQDELLNLLQDSESIDFVDSLGELSGLQFAKAEQQLLLGNIQVNQADEHQLSLMIGFDEAKFGVAKNWLLLLQKLQKSYS